LSFETAGALEIAELNEQLNRERSGHFSHK